MSTSALAALEAERARIARDLHDGPIQSLTAATLSLEAVRRLLDSGRVVEAAAAVAEVQVGLAHDAEEIRRVMSGLRPPPLAERGLARALRELGARLERDRGLPVLVEAPEIEGLAPEIQTVVYRVVQEALTNAAKHARASGALVRVTRRRGSLAVEVADDGTGFDPARPRRSATGHGVGLGSMRERAELLRGTLTLWSRPGSGTRIRLRLPLQPALADAS
jgi:two-component system sensor histidine kinase DegS